MSTTIDFASSIISDLTQKRCQEGLGISRLDLYRPAADKRTNQFVLL